jgi:hypothetical protein
MQKQIISLVLGLALLGAAISASAAGVGAFTITLQDAGNDQTLVSLVGNNFVTNTGLSVSSSTPVNTIDAFSPVFSGFINNLDGYAGDFSLNNFGTFSNPNGVARGGAASALLDGIQFVSDGGSSYTLDLNLGSALGVGALDLVNYSPGVFSGVINVPISIFNPGTYSYTQVGHYSGGTGVFNPNIVYTLNVVQPVPEPSTLALAGLGGASLLLFRRRK